MRNQLRFHNIIFAWGSLKTNHHGTEKPGEKWNQQTVKGWKLVVLDLNSDLSKRRKQTRFAKRIILYFPSGAWWHFDIYKPRGK